MLSSILAIVLVLILCRKSDRYAPRFTAYENSYLSICVKCTSQNQQSVL